MNSIDRVECNKKGLICLGYGTHVKTKKGKKINIGNFGKHVSKLEKGLIINEYNQNSVIKGYKTRKDILNKPLRSQAISLCKRVVINKVGDIYANRFFLTDAGKRKLTELRDKHKTQFTHIYTITGELCYIDKLKYNNLGCSVITESGGNFLVDTEFLAKRLNYQK